MLIDSRQQPLSNEISAVGGKTLVSKTRDVDQVIPCDWTLSLTLDRPNSSLSEVTHFSNCPQEKQKVREVKVKEMRYLQKSRQTRITTPTTAFTVCRSSCTQVLVLSTSYI